MVKVAAYRASLLNRLGWLIGTGLGSGLFPVAPATAGSLVALVIYFFIPVAGDSLSLYIMISVGFIVGIWATGTLITSTEHDPRQAVWDEFIGMWTTCLLLPKTLPWLAAAFICFRILDVVKPWPVRRLERLPGGLGIMADDLLAGIYGTVLLNAALLVIERLNT
ncbi:MAG TPA: phosphatidylglycerophosphatase A [Dehalococcoidia bacterium]|jgi:phosphatidylglycerophosphatase A|nr:phosphatidylglycerophosphatase A [Dehalococcoidia bacterium]